ncbi:MAG: hypothetical protein KIH10_16900 [Candidatus Freyarchaeota archaeon]|nr:hypothetical protein [Candidatus Jordarchaeia archaeon]MBS7281614.1 hypothetical protein [Candidatus Jordarchaeia archaeon]
MKFPDYPKEIVLCRHRQSSNGREESSIGRTKRGRGSRPGAEAAFRVRP